MTKKHLMTTLAAVLTLTLFSGLAGCGNRQQQTEPEPAPAQVQSEAPAEPEPEVLSGVISIKVNPEIAVSYDENGMVTSVEGRNDDGKKVIADYADFEGKECRTVIRELISKINEAGYFVEETEGGTHQITLEIEEGSVLPSDNFLSAIVDDIQNYTSGAKLNTPVAVNGESGYGWTNYGDTDYGPDNDGITNYDDTDYGTTADGATDYEEKPAAAPANTGGSQSTDDSGNSDYGNTDYGSGSDGNTNYDDGQSNYNANKQTTQKPAAQKPAAQKPAASGNSGGDSGYDDGSSNYGGGSSNYGGGDSGYDSGNSNYGGGSGDSGYDGGDSGYDD